MILALAFSCAKTKKENLFPDNRLTLTAELNTDEFVEKIKMLPKGKNKFALTKNALIISASGKKRPHHAELAGDKRALSGGYISFNFSSKTLVEIVIDNHSGRLCPSYKSLVRVVNFLSTFNLINSKTTLQNKPNLKKCSK